MPHVQNSLQHFTVPNIGPVRHPDDRSLYGPLRVDGEPAGTASARSHICAEACSSDGSKWSLSQRTAFLSSRVWIAVTLLLATHASLLAYSATRHSPTLNEPGHLVAGLTHWEFGRFEVYRVNPPLVHYVSAIPVIMVGYEADWSSFDNTPGARPEYGMGNDFMRVNGVRSFGCLPSLDGRA